MDDDASSGNTQHQETMMMTYNYTVRIELYLLIRYIC